MNATWDNATRDPWENALETTKRSIYDGSNNPFEELFEEGSDEPYVICDVAYTMNKVYFWILFSIGVPGNIMTILTILTMQGLSPATFFVALLALYDLLALIVKFIFWYLIIGKFKLGDAGCKMESLVLFLVCAANWMLVLICAERFISVCYPLKKISIFTKRRSYIAASVVSAILLIFFGVVVTVMRGAKSPWNTVCYTLPRYNVFYFDYFYWIDACLHLFLPFLLIVVFTIGIIRGLHQSRRDRRSLLQKEGGPEAGQTVSARNNRRIVADTERVERAITIMMILAAVLFLVFTLPDCVRILIKSTDDSCSGSVGAAYRAIFKQAAHIMADSTHALNFFLYFVAARRFREQLWKLVRCKAWKKVKFQNKYQNTYSTQVSSSTKLSTSVCPQSPLH